MTSGDGCMEICSQTVDFSSNVGTEQRKEKHKKEKKEKKEKKKKKHKEKDKEREDKKSHKNKEQPEPVVEVHESQGHQDEIVPKLTLKISAAAHADVKEEPEQLVPKLVIKPFGGPSAAALDDSFTSSAPDVGEEPYMQREDNSTVLPLTIPTVADLPATDSTGVGEEGKVWICPGCGRPDDGSPMIGCDGGCDEWYHWLCVGIDRQPPEDQEWFCPNCVKKEKKKKKKKKKDKHKQ